MYLYHNNKHTDIIALSKREARVKMQINSLGEGRCAFTLFGTSMHVATTLNQHIFQDLTESWPLLMSDMKLVGLGWGGQMLFLGTGQVKLLEEVVIDKIQAEKADRDSLR